MLGLLVAALVCIVVGIATASGPWFVASLVASAAAGFLLWQRRNTLGARARSEPDARADTGRDTDPGADAANPAPDQVWVVDGRPRYHLAGCATVAGLPAEPISLAQAKQDGFIPCSLCAPAAPAG
jgi:hypothetical protein